MTELTEVESVLEIFCQGISGKRFHIHELGVLRTATSPQLGQSLLSDSRNIYLPSEFNFFVDENSNARAFRLLAMQQLAHREFGTFAFSIDTARKRIATLASQKPPSTHRESDLETFFRYFDFPTLIKRLFQTIESERVERRMLSKYQGAIRYRRELQPYIDSIHLDCEDALTNAVTCLSGAIRSVSGCQSELTTTVEQALQQNSSVYDSAECAVSCYEYFLQLFDFTDLSGATPLQDEEVLPLEQIQRQARLEDWEREIDALDTELGISPLQLEIGENASALEANIEGETKEPLSLLSIKKEREQLQRRLNIEKSTLGISTLERNTVTTNYRYDEWDYINRKWLRRWCLLHVYTNNLSLESDDSNLLDAIRPFVRPVRKEFEQIRPSGMKRLKRQYDGDEIDISATVDNLVDRRCGIFPDERIYSRRDRSNRDVSAVILVDLSASTDSPIEDLATHPHGANVSDGSLQDLRDPYFDDDDLNGSLHFKPLQLEREERRRVIDVQKEAVLLLATALESIGDLYAIYGFSGYGKENVELHVAKNFNQNFSPQTVKSIAAMEPKRSTRMGPAIRHSIAQLLTTGTAMKVLMLLSDGFPQDCDYGPDRSDHEYGVQDTAKALHEASQKGIQSFCVTVDRAGNDYLRRMCPKERYLIIDELDDLPVVMNGVYKRLTAA